MISTKICFLSTYSYPIFRPDSGVVHGGAEIQMATLAKGLAAKEGYKVAVFVGDFGQSRSEVVDRVKLVRTFNPQPNDPAPKKLYQAFLYLKKLLVEDPDVVVTSTANSTVGLVAFYCLLFRKKHIHRTAHENDVNTTWITKNGVLGKVYKWGLERANIVLTQNADHQSMLKNNHSIEARVFKNRFSFSQKPLRKPNGYALWVARFELWKAPGVFLELARLLPQFSFKMVCPLAKEKLRTEWDAIKKAADALPNVDFIEHVPFQEIQDLFNHAKIFVNTSEQEGFPNTFIQAGIAGAPVLSYKVNPDNFIEEYNCGRFARGNMEELVALCKCLFEETEEWDSKSRSIFEYFFREHNIDQGISQLDEIVKSATGKFK